METPKTIAKASDYRSAKELRKVLDSIYSLTAGLEFLAREPLHKSNNLERLISEFNMNAYKNSELYKFLL